MSAFPIFGLLALSICLRVSSYSTIEENCLNSPMSTLRLTIELEKNETGHWMPVSNKVIDVNDPSNKKKLDLSYANRKCGKGVIHSLTGSIKEDYTETSTASPPKSPLPPDTSELKFSSRKGRDIEIINDGKSAFKSRKSYTHGAAMTTRSLNIDEIFNVKVESGYFHIGVTNMPAMQINFMTFMQDQPTGTWTWNIYWRRIYHDENPLGDLYSTESVEDGDTFGVSLRSDGTLHFYRNGEDQGVAAHNVKQPIYAFVDLIKYKTIATIVT